MRRDSGFTLIELMMTLAVLAILVGVGVPFLSDFVQTNRRAAAVNALVTDVQRARGVATTDRRPVVLCRSASGTGCDGAGDWSTGWIVFVDGDNDGAFDAGEETVSVTERIEGVTMPASIGSLRLYPGFRLTNGGTIAVCVDDDNANGRWVVVSGVGRVRLKAADTLEPDDPNC